jgi:hypothetical protein
LIGIDGGKGVSAVEVGSGRGGLIVVADPYSKFQEVFIEGNRSVILDLVGIRRAIKNALARTTAHEGAQDVDCKIRTGGGLLLKLVLVT